MYVVFSDFEIATVFYVDHSMNIRWFCELYYKTFHSLDSRSFW